MATVTITISDDDPQDGVPMPELQEGQERAVIRVEYDPDPVEQGWSYEDAPPVYIAAMEMIELWSRSQGATTTYEKTMDSRDGTTHERVIRPTDKPEESNG
jgi:hypothetical protein